MTLKVALLLLGLLVGAAAGYLTRPESAEIRLGGTTIEFEHNQISSGSSVITDGTNRHILLYTLAGGIIGLLAGFAAAGRRR